MTIRGHHGNLIITKLGNNGHDTQTLQPAAPIRDRAAPIRDRAASIRDRAAPIRDPAAPTRDRAARGPGSA